MTTVKKSLFSKPAWAAAPASKPSSSSNTTAIESTREEESIFASTVNYADIVAEQKAELARKAAKARAKAKARDREKEKGPPESKRRKISLENEDEDEGGDDRRGEELNFDDDNEDPPRRKESKNTRATRSTPKKDKSVRRGLDNDEELYSPAGSPAQKRITRTKPSLISLESDDDDGKANEDEDDDLIMVTPAKKNSKRNQKAKRKNDLDNDDDSEEEEEDEWLRELKQKAREKARLKLRQAAAGDASKRNKEGTPLDLSRDTSAAPYAGDGLRSPSTTLRDASRPLSSHSAPRSARATGTPLSAPQTSQEKPEADDPELKLLIQSSIAGTKSLIVKRRASQSLQQVREYWCRKFDLPEDVARTVVLTWKGTRLWDSTTMRGIIDGLKREGHERQRAKRGKGGRGKRRADSKNGIEDEWLHDDDEDEDTGGGGGGGEDHESSTSDDSFDFDSRTATDPSAGQILLEAMTLSAYEDLKRRELLNQQPSAASPSPSPSPPPSPAKDDGIIIRLISQHLAPMSLRVRAHTTVEKIMRGYAATRPVEEGKTPWLIFEGERLDPAMTVEELGIEEDEVLEVSIR